MQRICYLALGHIFVVLAVIGAILPVMPTVVFLIGAAWAYGKGSVRLQKMIHEHPKYGPMILNWEKYGVIPKKAKILAGIMMTGSVIICFLTAHHFIWPGIAAITMAIVYAYIWTRPSQVDPAATSAPQKSDPH